MEVSQSPLKTPKNNRTVTGLIVRMTVNNYLEYILCIDLIYTGSHSDQKNIFGNCEN